MIVNPKEDENKKYGRNGQKKCRVKRVTSSDEEMTFRLTNSSLHFFTRLIRCRVYRGRV